MQEKWGDKLKVFFEDFSSYPVMEDWAVNDLEQLRNIKKKLDKIIDILDENSRN